MGPTATPERRLLASSGASDRAWRQPPAALGARGHAVARVTPRRLQSFVLMGLAGRSPPRTGAHRGSPDPPGRDPAAPATPASHRSALPLPAPPTGPLAGPVALPVAEVAAASPGLDPEASASDGSGSRGARCAAPSQPRFGGGLRPGGVPRPRGPSEPVPTDEPSLERGGPSLAVRLCVPSGAQSPWRAPSKPAANRSQLDGRAPGAASRRRRPRPSLPVPAPPRDPAQVLAAGPSARPPDSVHPPGSPRHPFPRHPQ